VPRVLQDSHQDEQRDTSEVGMHGYYSNFGKYMAMRTAMQSDATDLLRVLRSDEHVDEVIKNAKLRDLTGPDEMVEPRSEGNQGDIYKILEKGKPYVLKIYKTGLSPQYTQFQRDLLKHIDDPEARAHPGFAAVCFAALPVGWATHMAKKGLVFRYVIQPRKPRKPTANDRAQVRDQIAFLHWLGYVHLDITDRNIMLADKGKCYLMDYDCVCKIGRIPLGPLPPESSEPIMRRDPAELDADDHLWQLLQTSFFKDLHVDEVRQAPVEVKWQQASGEGLVH